jgi:hypothetical protein
MKPRLLNMLNLLFSRKMPLFLRLKRLKFVNLPKVEISVSRSLVGFIVFVFKVKI